MATDPTPNGQTWRCGRTDPHTPHASYADHEKVCPGIPRPVPPAPSQRDPELAAALNEQLRQSYNAETLRTRPAPSSDERAPFADLTDEEFAVFAEGAGFDPGPGSDTPSDERACERPGCGHPMDDHDGEHGCEDCVMCPAYVPPIGSRLHGQWAGSNEDPVRWCALCGTWEDEADWITHSGHASLFPTDDVRHADAVTAEPEWSTRPVPSSDTPAHSGRDGLTLREAAIEAILIREQDTAFPVVARHIAALFTSLDAIPPTCPTATCHGCPDPEACEALRPTPVPEASGRPDTEALRYMAKVTAGRVNNRVDWAKALNEAADWIDAQPPVPPSPAPRVDER